MEEVWENMSLTSLHNPTSKPPNIAPFNVNTGTNFHDFFNNKDPYAADQPRVLQSTNMLSSKSDTNMYHSVGSPSDYPRMNSTTSAQMGFVGNPSSVCSSKKRTSMANNDDDSASERRRKRLIKNRESADRSRARRQAYTNEMEQEIEDLKKENAKLREQLKKVSLLAAARTKTTTATTTASTQQLHSTKGNSLSRTLTAPF